LATPVGEGGLDLVACVVSLDGSRALRAHARAPMSDARRLGTRVGIRLLEDGAAEILEGAARRTDT
jgi:porphobilinogen deaminase